MQPRLCKCGRFLVLVPNKLGPRWAHTSADMSWHREFEQANKERRQAEKAQRDTKRLDSLLRGWGQP